jgi:hemerythrin-like domain-containing protein
MDPIDVLMDEHRLIERALDALVVMADHWHRGGVDGRSSLREFVRFVREYADTLHHGKEEDLLFTAMIEAGLPGDQGPIGCMLSEHDLGRKLVAALAERTAQPAPWTDADRVEVVRLATAYATMLRQHIAKEDQVLYPLARARVVGGAFERLTEAFAEAAPTTDDGLVALGRALLAQAQAVAHQLDTRARHDRSLEITAFPGRAHRQALPPTWV